jgi:hypothetical protein
MKVLRRSGLATLALASVVALASCGSDSNEPSGGGTINNPAGLQTDVTGLVGTLTAGPLIGIGNIGNFGSGALDQLSRGHGSGIAAILGARPTIVLSGHGYFKVPRLVAGAGSTHPIAADGHIVTMGDAIDDSYYTTVFAYNPTTQQYEDDGTNAGPANGVRFVIYDDVGGSIDPNTPLGYLDVLDQSDPTKSEVGIVVKDLNGTVTYADYAVTLPDTFDPVAETFDLLSGGTLSDGQDDVDFSMHLTQTGPDAQVVNVGLTGPNSSMSLILGTTDDPQTDDSHLDLDITVQGHNETVQVAGTQDYDGTTGGYATDFTIRANNRLWARATTDDGSGDPVWVKEDGSPLTNAEQSLISALGTAVFGATLNIFALVYFALLMVSV